MTDPIEVFNDPSEVETHYKERGVEIRLKPEMKGAFLYKKSTACSEGMFFRTSEMVTPWSMVNLNESNVFFLALPLTGHATWEIEGKRISPGAPCVIDNLKITEASYSPGTRLDTVVIPADTLHAALASLRGSPAYKRLSFDLETAFSPTDAQSIMHIAAALKLGLHGPSSSRSSPIAVCYLRQALTTILLEGGRHNYSGVLQSMPSDVTPARIKRAIDFMQAYAHEPLRLEQIADQAALSVRGLQAGFMRYKGVPPMRFLRQIRLEGVRSDLLDPSVKANFEQIVLRWGFTNFSRFSRTYAEAFGESPRETFSKAR